MPITRSETTHRHPKRPAAHFRTLKSVGSLRLAGPLAIVLLAGCSTNLDGIDADLAGLVEQRSSLINVNKVPDQTRLEPDEVLRPGMWDSDVPTVNPRADELRYKVEAEAQDVAAKLDRYAQEAMTPAPGQEVLRLDLEDALRIAQETGREHRAAEEQYLLAAIRLLIERHLWTPRFFNDTIVSVAGSGNDGSFTNTARLLNDLSVRQRLPYGGEISAGMLFEVAEQLREAATEDYRQSADLIFNANIPLLRGAGMVAREDLIQAERNLIYEARDFEEFRRSYLVSIARDYFDLLELRARIANQERQISEDAEQPGTLILLLRGTEARVDAGREARFNLELVRNQVLGERATLAALREQYLLGLDRFKIRLGLPVTQAIDVEPLAFDLPLPDVTLEEATDQALLYRLDLQNRRDQLDDARRGVAIARNQLLPDLDLAGEVRIPTDPDDDTAGFDFRPGDTSYTASATLSLPLDRRIERLQLRQSLIGYEQAVRGFREFRDQVIVGVRQAVRNIDQARFQLQLAEQRVQINRQRLLEQQLKVEEVETDDIVRAQEDLLEAENQRDSAVTELRNAILQYLLESGQLRVGRDGTFQPLPGMFPVEPTAPPAEARPGQG